MMEDAKQLKVGRNGSVRLPAQVRETLAIKVGDLLDLVVNDGVMELTRTQPEYHYAKWRSISHELLVEKRQESV